MFTALNRQVQSLALGFAYARGPMAPLQFAAMSDAAPDIFDRDMKAAQRDRSAFLCGCSTNPGGDQLSVACADNLLDKLRDVVKQFNSCLVLGGAGGTVMERLLRQEKGHSLQQIVYVDQSMAMIERVQGLMAHLQTESSEKMPHVMYHLADEDLLPYRDSSFDLIMACNSLHWVNDLTSAFKECRRVLKPDGLFMASMLGGETLHEMRVACSVAEQEREGGVSLRTSPLIQVRDAGNLLTEAQFTLQTVDTDDILVQYEDVTHLVEHLRMLGEQNAALQRRPFLSRDTALAAAAIYSHMFGSDDGVEATYQAVFMTGWAPDPSQPRASKRGSATVSMKTLQEGLQSGP